MAKLQKKYQEMQERFCQEYIIDLNATQAAIRSGYCERSAREQGCRLLTKSNIQTEIQRLKVGRSERTDIKADAVVCELAKLAFSNIEDYLTVNEDGETRLKNFEDIERNVLAAIESIKISTTKNKDDSREYKTTQFKLCSKLNALEQLGKHLGIYQKDNEQKGQTIFDILAIVGVNLGNSDNRAKTISGKVG